MQPIKAKSNSKLTTLILGALAALVVVSVILFPDKAFQSSLEGLTVWWKLVFPAMMPFLIMTELLIGFGVIQGAGVLLEPLMRGIFRLPGVSGWALVSGLIVGFPTGAKITASLREKKLISRTETEQLTALSHLCSPLFLIIVVGVGFLHSAKLGVVLAVVHYISAIATGILQMKFSRKTQQLASPASEHSPALLSPEPRSASVWRQAFITMRQAYLHDGRAFGKLLGDAVTSSVQTLMLVGGYMMIFSVLINVVHISHLTDILKPATHALLQYMNIHTDTSAEWVTGMLEIHLGAYAWSQAQGLSLLGQMALISAFLGWGGLSAHAQVAGFQHQTEARYRIFFRSRVLHAVLAFIFTILLWKPLQLLLAETEPSFLWLDKTTNESPAASFPLNGDSAWSLWGPMLTQFLLVLLIMLMASTFIRAFRKKAL
ncbi:hypothetical protein BC351_00035 [Paenibacillus ferrarius]|uniref:Nucleoside transporter/FeoB GTPase Gate domain-containing protein n=1 Tax=Paenibacillus ferrarius TaxID=1469647 RepID=A0A1V4HSB0_9BACL|nr:nucleoside recognition domain-containing protein [Paenibacillus ferrarius]OPH61668.1 hypothetical protein BC351_00035 [Paenibacillus ferrarius]